MKHKHFRKGFTLIELLVVVAIIGVLAAVILASLSSARGKGNDAKVQSQLKSMVNQAQLFSGAQTAVLATTTAPVGAVGGNMFNDSTSANNSLYNLIAALPSGTAVYYAKNSTSPILGGLWAFAASTSVGSACVDHNGVVITKVGTVMTAANAAGQYSNLAASYICT